MADSENTRTVSRPNNDPALAMSAMWQADCDRLEEAVRLASARERALFNASADIDARADAHAEAERLFLAAAKVRDQWCDKLQIHTEAIFKTPAQSFEGLAAKVAVLLRDSAPSPDDPMPPWTYLRSVQSDLDRLIAATKAAAANDDG